MTSAKPAARGPVALPQAIRQWRESAVTWVRRDSAETAALLAKRKGPVGVPRVVVVGETNRGKSSLINSLLGVRDLSPVDANLATCTYLQFSFSAAPSAVAHFAGGMADITFPISELHSWATMDSEPDGDLPPPRWIEVTLREEFLQKVTLVDTPGVGGLVAGHAELALEAAAAATALVFVVDASAPFTRGEIEFLQQVGERVDAVYFVMTKTDAHRGWREIVQADQQLLAQYVPRFADAPFYPVSNTLAVAAESQPDPRIADVIREQSGIVQLRRILSEEVAARASLLADANHIRTALTVLGGELAAIGGQRRALTNGAAEADALRARREELLGQRKTGGRSWQVMLRAEIQRVRVDLTHDTAREVREAQQMFRGAIDAADADSLKQMPMHIDAYAQSMTARAHGRLLDGMGRIVNAVLAELFTVEELSMLAASLATRPYAPLVTRGPERTKSADDTIMSLAGGGIGLTLGGLVRMAAAPLAASAFGVVVLPVSIALGGAAAFLMVRSRRRMQDKQHLKQWLNEVLSEAKAQIDQNIAEQFIEADAQLTLALDDALAKQVAALDTEIKNVDGALKLDATERAGRLRTLDERESSGGALLVSGEALLERIRNTRPVGSVMLPGVTAGAARKIAVPPGLGATAPAAMPASGAPPVQPPVTGPAEPSGHVPTSPGAGPALAHLAGLTSQIPVPERTVEHQPEGQASTPAAVDEDTLRPDPDTGPVDLSSGLGALIDHVPRPSPRADRPAPDQPENGADDDYTAPPIEHVPAPARPLPPAPFGARSLLIPPNLAAVTGRNRPAAQPTADGAPDRATDQHPDAAEPDDQQDVESTRLRPFD